MNLIEVFQNPHLQIKTKIKIKSIEMNKFIIFIQNQWFVILILSFSLIGFMPDKVDFQLKDFQISIENQKANSFTFYCKEGCNWSDLSFECTNDQCEEYIDNHGMVKNETKEKFDFLINFKRNNNEIHLKCMRGCAWKTLNFQMPLKGGNKTIDQYGMTSM